MGKCKNITDENKHAVSPFFSSTEEKTNTLELWVNYEKVHLKENLKSSDFLYK